MKEKKKKEQIYHTRPPRPVLTQSRILKSDILNLMTWSNSSSMETDRGPEALRFDSDTDKSFRTDEHSSLEHRELGIFLTK